MVINILNLNDNTPIFSSPSFQFEVMENVPNGTFIGQINAADDDDDLFGLVEYSLTEDLFVVDKKTGEIYSNGEIDREVRPVFNFQGLATDGGKSVDLENGFKQGSTYRTNQCELVRVFLFFIGSGRENFFW